jgi:hypothetical protein
MQRSTIEELFEAIHPTQGPASEYTLDRELVAIAFSYPSERIDGGKSGSVGEIEWNSGR